MTVFPAPSELAKDATVALYHAAQGFCTRGVVGRDTMAGADPQRSDV